MEDMTARKAKVTPNYNQLLCDGNWNKMPHRAVIGSPTSFYLWRQRDKVERGSSTLWITGREAFNLLAKLKQTRLKSRQELIEEFDKAFSTYRQM